MTKFINQISLRERMAIGFGLLFATFIWTLYYVNVTQPSCKGLEQYLKPAFSSYMMVDLDSLAPENHKYSLPEKIEIIRSQQQLVLNREAELINDFRQEMNNNINKMNTWLAFAIGIMSVVGVFIPVILQINLRKEDNNERRGFYRKLLNKSNKLESSIKDNSKKAEAELKDALKAAHDSIIDARKTIEKDIRLQQMLINFLSFKYGCDDNILQNQPDRDLLMRYVWCKATDAFEEVVNDCLNDVYRNEESRARLMISLIMIYSLVEKIKASLYTRRLRELDKITDHIKKIIVKIEVGQQNTTCWDFMIKEIKDVNEEIQQICTVFS